MNYAALILSLQAIIDELIKASGLQTPDDVIPGTEPPVTYGQYFANITLYPGVGRLAMIDQARRLALPHDYVQWTQGVLPELAGTNDGWMDKYADFKPFYQNAYDAGVMKHPVEYTKLGEAVFKRDLAQAYFSDWGKKWLADPRTVGMRPKQEPNF